MIEKMAMVIATDDLDAAVAAWSTLLATPPSFVDPGRWAQFDTPAGRVALAAGAEAHFGSGVMLKVADLDATHARLAAAGLAPGAIETGPHERRFAVGAGGAGAIFYAVA